MYSQRSRKYQNVRSRKHDFIDYLITCENIQQLPYNNNASMLVAHASSEFTTKVLTGKGLLQKNVEEKARQLRKRDKHMINSATESIWNLRLTSLQRDDFERLANEANNIIQNRTRSNGDDDMSNMMTSINTPQVTNQPFGNYMFNGINFHDDNSFESLMLPAGHYSTSFLNSSF
ncbi:10224_t:CDS:1 [Funneliformis geosporum]|uniref:915_t:CDS:1 n=1 Tax=Funneliformis geosporum TaxID=1117311 RepID=A0A9W4SH12_9GLOM|nr:915_t:CDS:1 [Funneliformis geosporum]CAI2181362.1 10224_t:CDS:1 [Funneliformis geosporum]